MKISNRHCNLSSIKLNYILCKTFFRLENFVKFTSSDKGHHKVKSKLTLKQIIHSDKEGVITREQNIFLQFSISDLIKF